MPNENVPDPKVVVVWPGPEVKVRGADVESVKRGLPSLFVGLTVVEIAQQGAAMTNSATIAGAMANSDLGDMANTFVKD
jgi:hypothetical protein